MGVTVGGGGGASRWPDACKSLSYLEGGFAAERALAPESECPKPGKTPRKRTQA
jgi:hypothetical protein